MKTLQKIEKAPYREDLQQSPHRAGLQQPGRHEASNQASMKQVTRRA
ncbi:MAG: hypothetical protein GX754_11615 [Clostridiaceae bacterium]|nr:hypothetical protein [Clostridiaceae bacterium]